jgi:hypothetical protein
MSIKYCPSWAVHAEPGTVVYVPATTSTLPTLPPVYVDGVTTVQPGIVVEPPANTGSNPEPGSVEPAGRVSKLPFVRRLAGAAPAVPETTDTPVKPATPTVTSTAATVARNPMHRSALLMAHEMLRLRVCMDFSLSARSRANVVP